MTYTIRWIYYAGLCPQRRCEPIVGYAASLRDAEAWVERYAAPRSWCNQRGYTDYGIPFRAYSPERLQWEPTFWRYWRGGWRRAAFWEASRQSAYFEIRPIELASIRDLWETA